MEILIVGDIPPGPVRAGNQEVNVRVIRLLESMGHKITYLYVYRKALRKNVPNEKPIFNSLGLKVDVVEYRVPFIKNFLLKIKRKFNDKFKNGFCKADDYYPNGLSNFVKNLCAVKSFDACIVHYFYLSKLLKESLNITLRGLMTHDSFIYRNFINGAKIPALTPSEEAKVLQRAPTILSIQNIDSLVFHRLSPKSHVYTVYMPIIYTRTPITGNHNILFFSGDSEFNHIGLSWFIEKVLPKVKLEFKDAKLIVGGGICRSLKFTSSKDNIELYGYVDDEISFFRQGDIAINPVNLGSGLKIKTLQSLANDKITLTTSHSAEGLYNKKTNSLIISDDENEWVKNICNLWNNQELIKDYKDKNESYFNSYNEYILRQYEQFLNGNQ